jgi:hypothetical protein
VFSSVGRVEVKVDKVVEDLEGHIKEHKK